MQQQPQAHKAPEQSMPEVTGCAPTALSPTPASGPRITRRNLLGLAAAGAAKVVALGAGAATALAAVAGGDAESSVRIVPPQGELPHAPLPLASRIATKADYTRGENLWAYTANKVFRRDVHPHWFEGQDRFWYVNTLPHGECEYVLVDAAAGWRRPAFDPVRMAAALRHTTGKIFDPHRLSLTIIAINKDASRLHIQCEGRTWQLNLGNYNLTEAKAKPLPRESYKPLPQHFHRWSPADRKSPDGKWLAFIQEHNVFLRPTAGGKVRVLSTDGFAENHYDEVFYWSPDSTRLVVVKVRQGANRVVTEVEWAPPGSINPRTVEFRYLKPGDPIPIRKPCLFDVSQATEIPVSDKLFANPWSVNDIRWWPDSSRFTFLYNQRGHQVMRVVSVDAHTCHVSPIVNEECKTFFDYAGKLFTCYLDATHELIWMSERDGWNHLYLYDMTTGRVKNQITNGSWVVRKVVQVDNHARTVLLEVGGIFPEQDPYYIHYIRVNFNGTNLVHLTHGDGTHHLHFSPDGKYYFDHFSRVDLPPATELRRTHDGSLVCPLERADAAMLLKTGLPRPERFEAPGRDGITSIYGLIFRPSNFDPAIRYPVVEDIYAGPQDAFVPKGWQDFYWQQTLAEIGFIVVKCDGMGTSNRSKAFHDVCWKNLGDSGFPDRIPWIKAAAQSRPWMDIERVGIHGTSAGGQSAMRALLAFGEFYKVAVANSGCHDNRVDKIWWNELWMCWPIGHWYVQQSNAVNAHKLAGKLMLIVGGMDHNVDPACTFQVVDALIRANKDFDLLVVPNGHHGCGGPFWHYTWRRTRDFLVRHLWHFEPRSA
ncbi:MAG: prolyl oligopeptidase family serine peptidase [Phycisphaerales bacterium]|nr:prolyl oligopeptidase family serine peptidase [Phycisphaerales bacterium]